MALSKTLFSLILTVLAASDVYAATLAPLDRIGHHEALNVSATAGVGREDVVSSPGASYISVKFADFQLPAGDVVVVRSPDASQGYAYTDVGRGTRGAFVSSPIRGDTAIVEYLALNATSSRVTSYRLVGFVRGSNASPESVCGQDNTRSAKCYANWPLAPLAYTRSRAVARLLIEGSLHCTGWLVGSAGHLITNQHCVASNAQAEDIEIEFGAEGQTCADACSAPLACPGTTVVTSATLVASDAILDYALLQLPSTPHEQIYIPQYPLGWGRRIAAQVDNGSPAAISFTNRNTVCGANTVGYMADTQGGSSGAPVIAASDNRVVALHACGSCDNLAMDIRDVVADIEARGIIVPGME
ncbi:hypothetical protein P43SY_003930 [Pythium insidiosum]|uniref:Serine protease n=1 Tax=Pythium insidiosum TaxID=114742 RepID=A0AAD5LDQ0_PYTIN|nr:hypothetical protein P43SY_003930 [Pythium insidiosum]